MNLIKLYAMLPKGKENGISSYQAAEIWNTTERKARKWMEKMIYNDLPVCNLRHGYFRPETVDELIAYTGIIRSYKCKFEKKEYRLRKAIENFNQYKLPLAE